MRRILSGLLLISLALVARPAWAQSQDERAVRALLDRFIQSANSTDPKLSQQNLADHSRSGGPFFPPFTSRLGSVAEVEAMVNQTQGQVTSRNYAATSPITVRVDKNHAWAAYTWQAGLTFKDGSRYSYQGRATAAFVREGKTWKFAHWHSSIAAPPPLTAAARDAEAQKLIEMERSAWEAIRSKQLAALENYFADDASVFVEGSAYRLSGKANLLRGLAAFTESSDLRSFQILEPQVQLLGDTALLSYYFTEAGTSGGKEFSSAGKITMVFVKQDGVWRALHEHRSVNR